MEFLTYERNGTTGILAFHRPEARNALNSALLAEALHFLAHDLPAEPVRALVLTGSGEKAFVAGADIREMQTLDAPGMLAFLDLGGKVASRLEALEIPVIAAVNGFALGGGLEMALACDFLYASRTAKFGLPETTLGLIPGFGGTQRLSRAIGRARAKELIFTGRMIDADEALAIGLVNRVLPTRDELLRAALETAGAIARNGAFAVRQARRAVNLGFDLPLSGALELERQACVTSFETPDRREGMAAFLEKRKAAFPSNAG